MMANEADLYTIRMTEAFISCSLLFD
jgi:hypothetical protein